ncbi:outer membrane receptor protein involved in Fe transport [Gelidibacter sediminis]|uniref:Outer membrane receptor protein involved in Fe transport n=1 Tax=Gelidibacter sediminis TaxID=1608710 RepID=A0A4R7PWT7_9FLAO|nr:outer membrane beta-barrel family protein [Gelidibacter sediminis]TDU39394.1 outer membrane receptor protein involved in Fe transport [Gelidibacter sediminis]
MKSLVLLCMVMCTTLYAQPSATTPLKDGTISGKVLDASQNQPLPYVTIIIKNKGNENVTGAITLEDGSFTISKIPEGQFSVLIQYMGYKTITRPFYIGKDNYEVDLGNIFLEEDVAALDEVTVVAEVSTIQQKVDRKVITVGKDLTTSGATASDIMNNIPSVSVDQQTGNLSLRGNENVRVMVDGKLSNVPVDQLLKQIPSTSIKQIELITNPSAKYNPEGMSGIINIILHKNTNIGFNGNLNIGLTKEVNARFNSSIDLNYRNGKFNLYGNYGNNIGNSINYGIIERTDDNSQQLFNFDNNNKSHLYKFGVDFYADDNNTISIFTNQNSYDGKGKGLTRIRSVNTEEQRQEFNNISDNLSSQYNLVYKHLFAKEGEKIELEADYNVFEAHEHSNFSYYNISFPPNYMDIVNTERDQTTINIDYVNPLNDKTKLEAGLEARLFTTDVHYNSTGQSYDESGSIINTPRTDFNYDRTIYSAYITFGKTIEKWSYQVGARAEAVTDEAEAKSYADNSISTTPFKNDYLQVYPSAFLTYTPSEKNSYQASISRRVDRPGLQQINPIREWSTPLVSSFGNSELQPQFTNSIELNYTRKLNKGTITGGVFYRIVEDEINRAVFIDRLDLNKVILTYDNFDNTSAYGIELSSSYKPAKWWSFNSSFDLFAQTQTGISEVLNTPIGQDPNVADIALTKIEVDNIAYSFRMNNTFKTTKNLTLSLFGLYRSAREGIQFTGKSMYFVNTGLRYTFLDDAATFSFNYNDILNTMRGGFEGNRPYKQVGEFNWESNTWNVGLSYRFGGGKYRALQRKNRDTNEKSGGGGFM